MKNEKLSKVNPVMLGMTLSLLVLLLVTNKSFADTQCDLCLRNASNRAQAACPNDPPPWTMMGCYYKAYMKEKVECDSICGSSGGGGTISGSADCGSTACRELLASEGQCGFGSDPGAGTICTNDCWGKSCTGGKCYDVSAAAPLSTISFCHSQCGCKTD